MWQIIDNYFGIVVMMIGVISFGRIVLDEPFKITKVNLVILMIFICLGHTILYQNLSGAIKTIIMCFVNIYLYKNLFEISTSKAILLTFLYMIILIIPDALELVIATKVLGVSKFFYYNEYAGSFLCNAIVCILFIIMIYPFRKKINNIINIKLEEDLKIILYIILTFICMAVLFYKSFSNLKITIDLIVSIFAMFAFVFILFSLIKQILENNRLGDKYDKLLEYMVSYEHEIEKQRTLRHEIKNEFRTIRAKICDNQENKKIIEYIDEIVNDRYEIKQEDYAKFGYLPPNGIKGLCYFKTQEAEDKGLKVGINISKRVETSTIFNLTIKQQRDFGRILGVFLDNAIEASVNSKEKQLGIEAYVNQEQECKIIISNTYTNEIDKKKIGKEVFSTKGKNRGHGLLLVKQLIQNNNIFEIKTNIQDKIYVQTVIIKKT